MAPSKEKEYTMRLLTEHDFDETSDSSLDGPILVKSPRNDYKSIIKESCHHIQSQWKIVAFGQVISFLFSCSGAVQSTLSLNCHLSAPTFTVALYYACLSCFLIPLCFQQGRQGSLSTTTTSASTRTNAEDAVMHGKLLPGSTVTNAPYRFLKMIPLQAPAWVYFVMATLDVYASYFQVSAYHYTTITSVALLSALAIPSTMVLSYAFLGRRYTSVHLFGVGLSLVGIFCNVMQDVHDDHHGEASDDSNYPHKLRGDVLAILGGFLYGASEVMGELVVRKLGGPREYLGMMGFFGTMICIVQCLALERAEIAAFEKSEGCGRQTAWWLLIAFVAANILSYTGAAKFFQVSEATFFNLSLQTGGLWSVGFSVVAQHIIPQPIFFVALVVTVSGVIIYEMAPTPIIEEREIHKLMRLSEGPELQSSPNESDAEGVEISGRKVRARRPHALAIGSDV